MSCVHVEARGAVTVIRLDRPPVNAMDLDTLRALAAAIEREAHGTRPLVLAGREGALSAGIDLKAVLGYGPDEQRGMVEGINRMCQVVYGATVPVVAACTGHTIGGGLVLALCCDHRVGADRPSVYSLPEARAGVPFPAGAMAVVRAELAPATARRLALGDARLGPHQALSAGILDEVVEPEQVLERAIARAEALGELPARAFGLVKRQLRASALAARDAAVQDGEDGLLEGWLG